MFSEKYVGLGVDEESLLSISCGRLPGLKAAYGQGPCTVPPLKGTCYI